MTSLIDGALDLSAKQVTGRDDVKQEDVDDDACAARVHPEQQELTDVADRPTSSSSPDADTKRPLSARYSRVGSVDSPDGATNRSFKRFAYPDGLPGMYAAAAAAAQMGGQLFPYGGGAGGGDGGYNNAALYAAAAAAAASSPISQFMQQRKRGATPDGKALYPDTFDEADLVYHKRQRDGVAETKDEAYWERRRKNNEAAKRSRDMRRAKEEEIALRAACLEQENLKLRAQVAILKNDTAKLHYMLYNRM